MLANLRLVVLLNLKFGPVFAICLPDLASCLVAGGYACFAVRLNLAEGGQHIFQSSP
jgi:hypothetical protein